MKLLNVIAMSALSGHLLAQTQSVESKREDLPSTNFVEISYFKQRYKDPFFFPSRDNDSNGLSFSYGRRIWVWDSSSLSPYLQYSSIEANAENGYAHDVAQKMRDLSLGFKYEKTISSVPGLGLSIAPVFGVGKSTVIQVNNMLVDLIDLNYYKFGVKMGAGYHLTKELSLGINYELSQNYFSYPNKKELNYWEPTHRYGVSTVIDFD